MPVPFSRHVRDGGGRRVHRSLHGGCPAAAAPAARLQPPLLPSAGDSGCGPDTPLAASNPPLIRHIHEHTFTPCWG